MFIKSTFTWIWLTDHKSKYFGSDMIDKPILFKKIFINKNLNKKLTHYYTHYMLEIQ